jgi:hypothetical protein
MQNKKFIKLYKKFQKSYSAHHVDNLCINSLVPEVSAQACATKPIDAQMHDRNGPMRITLLNVINPLHTRAYIKQKYMPVSISPKLSLSQLLCMSRHNAIEAPLESVKVKFNVQLRSKTVFPKSFIRLFGHRKTDMVGTHVEIRQYSIHPIKKKDQTILAQLHLGKLQLTDLACTVLREHLTEHKSVPFLTNSQKQNQKRKQMALVLGAFISLSFNFNGVFISAGELQQALMFQSPAHQLHKNVATGLRQSYAQTIKTRNPLRKLCLISMVTYAQKVPAHTS